MQYVTGVLSLLLLTVCSARAEVEPFPAAAVLPDMTLRSQDATAPAAHQPAPRASEISLEAYGDSVTAGFLSNTTAMGTEKLPDVSRVMSDLAMFIATGDRKYIAGHEVRENAWPAVLGGLLGKSGQRYAVRNLAISGALTSDLLGQVNAGPRDIDSGISFFFVGHNDLCDTPFTPDSLADRYEASYEPALAAWDRSHKNSTAYFVRVGDVQRVFKVLKGHVWYHGQGHDYTCEDSWQRFFPYCRSYQKKLSEGTLDQFLTPRINAMNNRLPDIAARWTKQTTNHNRFVYVDDTTESAYAETYFAVDCYHLSPMGQRKLAEGIFREITK